MADTPCVYTITNPEFVKQTIAAGGSGQILEGRRWAGAHRHFTARRAGDIYPLLLGNASVVNGVEWVAQIDDIQILPDGKTRISFSGLCKLDSRIPPQRLRKISDGQPLSGSYIRSYVPCVARGATASSIMRALSQTLDGSMPECTRHFVAYHNTTKNGNSFTPKGSEFRFSASRKKGKVAQTAIGQNLWIFQGERAGKGMRYSLVALGQPISVDSSDSDNVEIRCRTVRVFAPTLLMNDRQWFWRIYQSTNNFSLGLSEVFDEGLEGLRSLAASRSSPYDEVVSDQTTSGTGSFSDLDALLGDLPEGEMRETAREAVVQMRLGQAQYRQALFDLWDGSCAVTGVAVPEVLVASHAKPWAMSNSHERLNQYNGLLLTANLDRLFDQGLIGFSDSGELLTGARLSSEEIERLGLRPAPRLRFVMEGHKSFLRWHRERWGLTDTSD